MTVTLALAKLYSDVVARFAADAAASWTAPIFTGTGTAGPTVAIDPSSTPTGAHDVILEVTAGGVVGVPGVFVRHSLDGGATWSTSVDLGVATSVAIAGAVTIDLTATKTLDTGDRVTTTTTPAAVPVPQVFGLRARAVQPGATPRIVWIPGDDASGAAGVIGPARNPGRSPRPIATWREQFTVYVEGVDQSTTDAVVSELAQYKAARLLFDAWLRAVYLAADGTFAMGAPSWVYDKAVRPNGATLRVLCTIEAAVPDAPVTGAPADAAARITVSVDNVDETDNIPAGGP